MAPTKRKGYTNNHAAATSPFKRLKAKVGKKAPKPANATDTNFRAASLHIKNQVGSLAPTTTTTTTTTKSTTQQSQLDTLVLTSGRGRSLTELMGQMHHPAAAVRISAIKGIQDIVQQHGTNVASIAANLSVLIAAIGKASVDEEDQDVRLIGLEVFQKILQKSTNENTGTGAKTTTTTGTVTTTTTVFKPFVPLTLAFLKSALNSLDRGTRREGLQYIHALARNMPLSLDAVIPILPAITRMWEDRAFQGTGPGAMGTTGRNKKKRKKKQQDKNASSTTSSSSNVPTMTQIKNGKFPILDCLFALLSGLPLSTDSDSQRCTSVIPDLTFIPGGSSKNAIFFVSSNRGLSIKTNRQCVETIHDLPSFATMTSHAGKGRQNGPQRSSSSHVLLDLDSANNLLLKCRDTMIELQQSYCHATFHLLAKVLDLFCLVYGDQITNQAAAVVQSSPERIESLRSVGEQIRTLLLDSFPMIPSSEVSTILVELINGQVCLTLVHMAQIMDRLFCLSRRKGGGGGGGGGGGEEEQTRAANHWIKPVVDHICSRLQDKSLIRSGNEESRAAILIVLYKLLSGSNHQIVQKVPRLELKLVHAFEASVIPNGNDISRSSARTRAGLICVDIIAILFQRVNYDLKQGYKEFGTFTFQITMALPDFLIAFEGDFLDSSATVMELLGRSFRQRDEPFSVNNAENDEYQTNLTGTMVAMRQKLEKLVDPDRVGAENGPKRSILETYPAHMQQQLINLIATLQYPTHGTLVLLSSLCAGSNLGLSSGPVLSPTFISFLIHTIFDIRKTIPMQDFLCFLIDSTGVTRPLPEGSNDEDIEFTAEVVMRFDQGVKAVSKCLAGCGVVKTTPMLCPLIQVFLETISSSNNPPTTILLLRHRFAFSILAIFALDLGSAQGNQSILPLLPDGVKDRIPEAVLEALQRITEAVDDNGKLQSLIMAPVGALLSVEPKLFFTVSHFVLNKFSTIHDESKQCTIVQWLIDLVFNAKFDSCSHGSSVHELVVDVKKRLEAMVTPGKVKAGLAQLLNALELARPSPSISS